MAFNDTGFKLAGRYLQISKIGAVKLRLSRPIPEGAAIQSLTVKRNGSHWYACLAVECPVNPLQHSDEVMALDMGIENFAALSNEKFIPNPRIYEQEQARLRRAPRRVARRQKGAHRRRKAVELLRKIHEHMAHRRLDFLPKESTKLVQAYGTMGVENSPCRRIGKGDSCQARARRIMGTMHSTVGVPSGRCWSPIGRSGLCVHKSDVSKVRNHQEEIAVGTRAHLQLRLQDASGYGSGEEYLGSDRAIGRQRR